MRSCVAIGVVVASLWSASAARADAIVADGRFTNVYVFPHPDKETWEQHMNGLLANQKPGDPEKFTRKSIDETTQMLMNDGFPSYFGALHQYGGINAPRFFGSFTASQKCVDAAMKSANKGVLGRSTVGTLANCHLDGMDPSPQVNLIFSPDIKLGDDGVDFCSEKPPHEVAYHANLLNTPNFAALPTTPRCTRNFAAFTESLTHEDVEMLSDPGGIAHGGVGGTELGDRCQPNSQSIDTTWRGVNVQRYRSDNDNVCWPLALPKTAATWVLGEATPIVRFTGDIHDKTLKVPDARQVTDAAATEVFIFLQTGSDDLRGGNDNADVTLHFKGGTASTTNINGGREWGNGQTHMARLNLGAKPPRVSDIESVTIQTHFGGGMNGDNWNLNAVALVVGFPEGSKTRELVPRVVHEWLNESGGPLVRFTGDTHVKTVAVPRTDDGKQISALELIISTGNDDLRGGNLAGDDCDVTIHLANGNTIQLDDINHDKTLPGWTDLHLAIPIPKGGLKGGDVKSVTLTTGFHGGFDGDNWNVQRIQLRATLK